MRGAKRLASEKLWDCRALLCYRIDDTDKLAFSSGFNLAACRTGVSVRFCGFLARRDDDAGYILPGGATPPGHRKNVQLRP